MQGDSGPDPDGRGSGKGAGAYLRRFCWLTAQGMTSLTVALLAERVSGAQTSLGAGVSFAAFWELRCWPASPPVHGSGSGRCLTPLSFDSTSGVEESLVNLLRREQENKTKRLSGMMMMSSNAGKGAESTEHCRISRGYLMVQFSAAESGPAEGPCCAGGLLDLFLHQLFENGAALHTRLGGSLQGCRG